MPWIMDGEGFSLGVELGESLEEGDGNGRGSVSDPGVVSIV